MHGFPQLRCWNNSTLCLAPIVWAQPRHILTWHASGCMTSTKRSLNHAGRLTPSGTERHRIPPDGLQVTAPKEVTETIYTDTVAVLPGYARAVAADLRGSSERWRQYQDPPSYFDDALGGLMYQMSPAASEAYQDDSVLGRALKVTCQTPTPSML